MTGERKKSAGDITVWQSTEVKGQGKRMGQQNNSYSREQLFVSSHTSTFESFMTTILPKTNRVIFEWLCQYVLLKTARVELLSCLKAI